MIQLYKIDPLRNSPFDNTSDISFLSDHNIGFTKSKEEADIFVAGNEKSLKNFILKNPFKQRFLLWTNEPRFSTSESKIYYPFKLFPKVHVMNVYTGDIFINNVTYQDSRFSKRTPLNRLKEDFKIGDRKIAALMSFYNGGKTSILKINGTNIDLIKKRSEIALFSFRKDKIDIFGSGWPLGISKEDSRLTNRHERKKDILKNYYFNLCFENTVFPRYITEKIWESIENYCLPIYYGGKGSSIYEIFPQESFLDYTQFKDPFQLLNYIESITDKEFIERMNRCINVYNRFVEKDQFFWIETKRNVLLNIVQKCNHIIS